MYRRVFGGMTTAWSRAARAAAVGAIVCLIEGLAIGEARRQTTANETMSAFVPPLVAILVYLAGGSIVLLSVAARDTSGNTRGALLTLPLSRIATALLEWIPVLATALVLLGLAITPSATALIAAQYPPAAAVGLIVTALAAGAGTGALVLSGVSLALRGSTWTAVRYPLAVLVWAAIATAAIWRSFGQSGSAEPAVGDLALVLPPIVRQAGFGEPIEPWVAGLAALGGLLVVGFVVPWAIGGQMASRLRLIRRGWNGGAKSSLMVGELVYSTRNATLVANAIAAAVLVLGLCVLLASVPSPVRQPLLAPVLIVAACLVGSVTRQQRSVFPARRPPQQLINLEGGPWVARQFGIAMLWFGGLYAPPLVTALWIGLPPGTVWSGWATAGASAFAISALAGWILPFPLDNAPGQLLASVATVSAAGAVGSFAVDVSSSSPLLSLALCLCALIVPAGAAVAAEQRRWAAG
ncbi:hypothetical protein [Sinomonas sp. G460-2]|uniref:hypothetical protein n=1 Tax=Sinomonas sp. G460-2 TaxID=3393464 RepID=UPI0039EDFFA5